MKKKLRLFGGWPDIGAHVRQRNAALWTRHIVMSFMLMAIAFRVAAASHQNGQASRATPGGGGGGEFSALDSPSTVQYNAAPHPGKVQGTLADMPLEYVDSARESLTFLTDVTVTDQGTAALNMAKINTEIEAAVALDGHTRIRLTHGLVYGGESMMLLPHDFPGRKTYIEAVTAPVAEGTRVTEADLATHPELRAGPGNDIPAISCAQGADNYRIMGVKCVPEPTATGVTFMTVNINARIPGQTNEESQTLPEHCPVDIILDRIVVLGPTGDTGTNATFNSPQGRNRNGVILNGIRCALVDSHVTGQFNLEDETHGILVTSTPGPLKFVNNYIDGGTVPLFFGGTGSSLGNDVHPSDIEIRRNHLRHPDAWLPDEGDTVGPTFVSLKGVFELKHAQRVLAEGNVIESCPVSAQQGMAVVIKSAGNGSAGSSGAGMGTSHATFRYNVVRNVRTAFNVDGFGDPLEEGIVQTNHITAYDNLFHSFGRVFKDDGTTISGTYTSGGHGLLLGGACHYLTFGFNTLVPNALGIPDGSAGPAWMALANVEPGTESLSTVISDNVAIVTSSSAPVFYNGGFYGDDGLDLYAADWDFDRNCIVGVLVDYFGNIPTGTGNVNPDAGSLTPTLATLVSQAEFVDPDNGNYRLGASSPGKGLGFSGADMGADIDNVELATAGVDS